MTTTPGNIKNTDLDSYRRATALRDEGNISACLSILLELAERNTSCWQVFDDLATHALSSGDTTLAIELLDMAIAREGAPNAASLNKAFVIMSTGKVKDAELLAQNYLKHHPEDPRALALMEKIDQPTDLSAPGLPKLIAYYLPQFHPIPENDLWWGKGFTEWTNVVRAKPQFSRHRQPRLPTELGFYDLRVPETRNEQAALARKYGIHGFCYYYYWFAHGKQLLEHPLNEVLRTGQPDFPFCICWANENWSRRWDGGEELVLMPQDMSKNNTLAFVRSLVPLVSDRRYIRVNGRPMILIYRVDMIPGIAAMAALWREEMRQSGIGEIYLVAVQTTVEVDPAHIGFDASCEFPPLPVSYSNKNDQITFLGDFSGKIFDYREAVRTKENRTPYGYKRFPGVMTRWDNTPRRKHRAHIYANASPAWYQRWLGHAIDDSIRQQAPEERFVFINAWNEWAEGAYLEPDEEYGHAFLTTTRDTLRSAQCNTSPLLRFAALAGDALIDDAIWNHRSQCYPENLRFAIVIDATNDTEDRLTATIDSLIAQSYQCFDLFVFTPTPRFTERYFTTASRTDLLSSLKSSNTQWIIPINAGDYLSRRSLHLFAEYAFTHPGAMSLAAEAAVYSASPWESRRLPRTTDGISAVSDAELIAIRHEQLAAAHDDTSIPLVRAIENTVPAKLRIQLPRFAALRHTGETLAPTNRLAPDDALPPGLPWKPFPRIVAHSGAWNDRKILRLTQPLAALRETGIAEWRITDQIPTLTMLSDFETDVMYLHNPRPDSLLNTLTHQLQDSGLSYVLALDSEAVRTDDGQLHPALQKTAARSKRVIVDSTELATELRAVTPNVIVIPDALADDWSNITTTNVQSGKKTRVGWFSDILDDTETAPWLHETIALLNREVDWICLGTCPDELTSHIAEQHDGWPLEDASRRMPQLHLDLALLPAGCMRTNAAAPIRALQLGACGCVVIASVDIPALKSLPVVGTENNGQAWVDTIRHLNSPAARSQCVALMNAAIASCGMLSHHVHCWADALLHPALQPENLTEGAALKKARADIAEGRIEEGIGALIKLATQGSSLWEIYDELGRHASQTGDNASAIELFSYALQLDPTASEVERSLERARSAAEEKSCHNGSGTKQT